MTPDRWQRAQELFVAALELETNPRTAFLDRECKGDSDLREEVESLLPSHHGAEVPKPLVCLYIIPATR